MRTPTSILVPTDLSDGSAAAARYAVGLAKGLGARVHLVHALPALTAVPTGMLHVPAILVPSKPDDPVSDRAAADLAAFKERLRAPAEVEVTTELRSGPARSTLVELAPDHDLVVMGTHGRTGLVRLALGSVAEHMVRHSPTPVLTVRADATPLQTEQTTVADIMSRNPVTLSPKVRVRAAAEFAERLQITHLLVEDPGDASLLGVACVCARCQPSPDRTLGEVMNSPAVTVSPTTGLEEAADLMRRRKVGALPVVDDDGLVGMLTLADIERRGLTHQLGLTARPE